MSDDWLTHMKVDVPETKTVPHPNDAKRMTDQPDRHGWRSDMSQVEEHKVYLTQHVGDLYPVPAYLCDGVWLRETEGPEDTFYGAGRHEPLYRAPTHYRELPPPPEDS